MKVVTQEPFCYWCLRTHCFQCWVITMCCKRCIKTRIRSPKYTYITIIVWDIIHHPINRIISIRSFVCFIRFFVWLKRTYVFKYTLTHPSTSYILDDIDILFFKKIFSWSGPKFSKHIFAIWRT